MKVTMSAQDNSSVLSAKYGTPLASYSHPSPIQPMSINGKRLYSIR